jgi:hypothetical protein
MKTQTSDKSFGGSKPAAKPAKAAARPPAAPPPPAAPAEPAIPLLERIPGLTDKELQNLHANAQRLAQSGKPQQKAAAEDLLPPLTEEIARRIEALRAHKAETFLARREAAKLKPRKPKAPKADAKPAKTAAA